ncbi:MAG: hypothetical protein NT099_02740 [Candidatus Saganbacteria bacterium]|nr:hypothetical protein [Candidatus Saganbacteria bacterium]
MSKEIKKIKYENPELKDLLRGIFVLGSDCSGGGSGGGNNCNANGSLASYYCTGGGVASSSKCHGGGMNNSCVGGGDFI